MESNQLDAALNRQCATMIWRLWIDMNQKLDDYVERVQNGKDAQAAQEFGQFVFWIANPKLFDAFAPTAPIKLDGRALQSRALKLVADARRLVIAQRPPPSEGVRKARHAEKRSSPPKPPICLGADTANGRKRCIFELWMALHSTDDDGERQAIIEKAVSLIRIDLTEENGSVSVGCLPRVDARGVHHI